MTRRRDPVVRDTAYGLMTVAFMLWLASLINLAMYLALVCAVLGGITAVVAMVGTKRQPPAPPVAANDDKPEWV